MGYDDRKQYLNLSNNAFYIMNCDALAFAGKKVSSSRVESGFLNRIFLNFLQDKEKMENLMNREEQYTKGVQFNFRLQTKAEKQISSIETNKKSRLCKKFIFSGYFNRNKCLKAVFEEYAGLPYYEREKIYFRSEFEFLCLCCKSSQPVGFDYRKGKETVYISMLPYDIRLDEWSSYNYLIGITKSGKIINCRLSFIQNLHSVSGNFSDLHKKSKIIEERIMTNGVQFLGSEPQKIIVRLTETGQNMYSTMIYLRPHYESCNPQSGIYEFFCTPTQIRYYFFKFGGEAEIIEPEILRQQFIDDYKKALDNYLKNSDE